MGKHVMRNLFGEPSMRWIHRNIWDIGTSRDVNWVSNNWKLIWVNSNKNSVELFFEPSRRWISLDSIRKPWAQLIDQKSLANPQVASGSKT